MANDFNGIFRNVTTNNLKVNKKAVIGNQAIYANQGNAYFVDSSATGAADTRSGTSWATCLATLDGAINKCANQGDVIFVAEGHTESYTTTGVKATFDTAGITVIGLGTGSNRPTFSFGHTGSTWTISAANITLVNLLFLTAVDSVVTFGTISGADCIMIACESRDTTDKEVLDAWTVATTANRLKVDSYKHIGYIGGDANDSVFQLSGVDDFIIQNCIFMTQSGTTAGSAVIELATECLRGLIDNCVFYVDGKSDYSDDIADTAGTSTVIVKDCYDLEAGGKFSGGGNGSSFSLAGDDVGTLGTAVAAIQTDLGDYSGRTNLKTSLALLGNPDAAGATTWSALVGSNTSYNSFLGTKVTKSEADILDGTQQTLFTVSGGRVFVTHIELEVTTAAVDAGANNTQIVTDPTVGTDAPMCAVLDVDGDEAGTIYSITGKPGDAMVGGSGGGAPGMEIKGFVVPEGGIDLLSAADGGVGGALIKAELWYIPLDSGASVASA